MSINRTQKYNAMRGLTNKFNKIHHTNVEYFVENRLV